MAAKSLPRLSFLAIALGALVSNGHLEAYAGTNVQVTSGATADVLRHVASTQIVNQAKTSGQSAERRNDNRASGDNQNAVQQLKPWEQTGTTGPMGPTGPTGPTGATGQAGADGAQGVAGAVGPVGPVGPMGAMGPMGPMGPMGFQGATGATGAKGADGAVGPAGPQGPQGPQGATGAAGANGADGAVGPAGPQGLQGAKGATGADGAVGPVGPQGPQGETGATGAAGADGADGTNGTNGLDGAVGPAGPTGPEGPAGPTGAQGPAGVVVQAEQTVATGTGWFTHYTDPSWVLESSSNGASLKLNRTAPTSDPAENKYLVFGMVYPNGCLGQPTAAAGATATFKQGHRVAVNPGDAVSGTMCLEGSFATISVQDQDKRTELRCTRISPTSIVCQKVN